MDDRDRSRRALFFSGFIAAVGSAVLSLVAGGAAILTLLDVTAGAAVSVSLIIAVLVVALARTQVRDHGIEISGEITGPGVSVSGRVGDIERLSADEARARLTELEQERAKLEARAAEAAREPEADVGRAAGSDETEA